MCPVTHDWPDVVPLLDSEYPGARANQERFGFRAVLAVPMMLKGEAIGVLFAWRQESGPFSAEQIATVLRTAARDFRVSAEFLASLAVAGTDGTIAHRMGDTLAERYVRAKTGTLPTVSCLSGFAGSPGHVPLVFSFRMNDVTNAAEARHTQDRAAELLVAYLEGDLVAKP